MTKKQLLKELERLREHIAVVKDKEKKYKRAKKILQKKEERYLELFNNINSGVAVYEAIDGGNDFVIIDFNRAGEKIDNIKREDLIGKSVLKVFPGIRKFGLFDVFKRVWKTGKPEHYPASLYKDGRISVWFENYVYKLPSGEIVAVFEDITERKKAEAELQESKKKYQELIDKSIVGIVVTVKGRIVFCNRRECELLGYENSSHLCGHSVAEFIHKDDIPFLLRLAAQLRNGKAMSHPTTFRAIRSDGKEIYIEAFAIQFPYESKDAVLSFHTDISERKRTAEKLAKAHKDCERKVKERTAELEKKNIALKEVLEHIAEEKMAVQQEIAAVIEQVLLPIVQKLKRSAPPATLVQVRLLEDGLKELIATLPSNSISLYSRLSPRGIEISNMIKRGLSSKEIANELNISPATVQKHRQIIRKKLGLTNNKVNLRSYFLKSQ